MTQRLLFYYLHYFLHGHQRDNLIAAQGLDSGHPYLHYVCTHYLNIP
jgi:hypothetical protein